MVLQSILLAISVCTRRLVCLERCETDARYSLIAGYIGAPHRSAALPAVRTGCDGGRKISAVGRVRSGTRAPYVSSERQGKYRPLQGDLFSGSAFLLTLAVPRDWRGFGWGILQPVIKCGEEWLPVFCAGVFLSFAAHFVLITGPDLLAMHVLVSISPISI